MFELRHLIRVSPTGVLASNGGRFLDVAAGESRSSSGVVKIGTGGSIDFSLFGTASSEVVVDVVGYWAPDPVGPVLITSTAAQPVLVASQAVAAGETVGVRIAGYTGVLGIPPLSGHLNWEEIMSTRKKKVAGRLGERS